MASSLFASRQAEGSHVRLLYLSFICCSASETVELACLAMGGNHGLVGKQLLPEGQLLPQPGASGSPTSCANPGATRWGVRIQVQEPPPACAARPPLWRCCLAPPSCCPSLCAATCCRSRRAAPCAVPPFCAAFTRLRPLRVPGLYLLRTDTRQKLTFARIP